MSPVDTDRNLLFGLLALQNGLIDQGALFAAFAAWTRDKGRLLADHLIDLGHLDAPRRGVIEAIAGLHVQVLGGDPGQSLAVLDVGRATREGLALVGGPDVEATLGHVGSAQGSTHEDKDPERTGTYSVGSATSDGQRFRIVRPHARGGLGAVFVALDSELDREVALKQILDDRADDPTSRFRFLIEAKITGGLEHPGIVPVYGLGSYGDGRPYYAMRFIRGDSLKEVINDFHAGPKSGSAGSRDLALRKLLRRFMDVCNAIDYAHSRGVIHRDIKPANIIVGRHGETLVVDWGLAKPMGRLEPGTEPGERLLMPLSASGSSETLPGSALGTPAYMSPEQAEGQLERLGPRSDIYNLGATLYCLLTGKPPFEGDGIDVIRAVQKGVFLPPRQVDPRIDAALEAICLKAMTLRPEDRYASSRVLADDLDRWMADEPVSSWREPVSRRARRWARRNRTAVTAAAVALVAGVIGLSAVLAVQTRAKAELAASLTRETNANTALADLNAELTRSRGAVQARYDLAVDAIKTFHTGVSEDFLLKESQFKELRDRLLESASDFYGKLGSLLGKETDLASRRALAQAEYEVAGLTEKVGREDVALSAHRRVLASREALSADPGADAQTKADVGRSLTAVASLLERTGKSDDAVATYRQAESRLAAPASSDPTSGPIRAALAACRSRLGYLLYTTGHATEGLHVLHQARSDQETLAQAAGTPKEAQTDLARTIIGIGVLLSATGKPADAEAEFRKAIAIQQKLADDSPAVSQFRSSLAGSYQSLGSLLLQTGKPAEAEAEVRKAIAIQQKLADDNPAVSQFRSSLSNHHDNLGHLLCDMCRLADAEDEFRKAIAIQQELVDDNPAVAHYRSHLAYSHNNLGLTLLLMGKPAEAEVEDRKAIAIHQKVVDDNPAVSHYRNLLAITHVCLGMLLGGTGRPAEAETELRKAIAIHQKLADDNPAVSAFRYQLGVSRVCLGWLLGWTGRPAEAEAEFRKGIAIEQELADHNPAFWDFRSALAIHQNQLGRLFSQTGRPSEAEAEFRKALPIQQKLADDNPAVPEFRLQLAATVTNLGDLVRPLGRVAECRDGYERAIAIFERLVKAYPTPPMYRSFLASALRRRGLAARDLGDSSGSAADVRRALELFDGIQSRSGQEWFETACCHAVLAGMAEREGAGGSNSEEQTAMSLLAKAVTMGYRDPGAYRTESALDPLRKRPDFQLLMIDLAFPTEPFARGN